MARPRYHGYLAKKKSPFLPFIPAEASGFLNSPARTAAPAKGSKTRSGRNDSAQTPPQSSSDAASASERHQTHRAPVWRRQKRFVRTWTGPSRALRSRTAASISVSFRRTWELTPPTEIPPYLRGGGGINPQVQRLGNGPELDMSTGPIGP